ncbi:MAG TPA: SRPBCC family protein [Vitreimonas sp.]|uniref:SRPBCC family protein n=1 Tax=Vitreimonas sp. TaxID=3069702 RepID=UPI002D465017|nr:SRPBCC family protein [Vitreimonas sp.]HYD88072.1 SRPBCC family protein [Vitreimonas sp.]
MTTTHASFVIERTYPTAPPRVFAAWADPEAKRAWFVEGEGWEIQSYELDFREGGTERSQFRFLKGEETFGEKTVFGNETVFNEIVDNERIIFTYSMDRNGVRFSISLASVELKPAGGGTRLIFTEHGAFFDGADGVKMREAGWRELLDKLDAHLAANA